MNEPRAQEAVAYLLGELTPDQVREFERRLDADDELRAEVERLRPVVARLDELPPEAWEAEPPPLRPPSGERVATEPSVPAPARRAEARRRWWTAPRIALAGGLAAAALALAFAAGTLVDGDGDPAPTAVELEPLADAGAGATGLVELDGGDARTATVDVEGLPRSAAGHHYELWLLGEGDPVPLGSFRVGDDGNAQIAVAVPSDPERFEAFDVSIERDGGDPSHSGDSVLRGPVAARSS